MCESVRATVEEVGGGVGEQIVCLSVVRGN